MKAIKIDFKVIIHVNITYRSKELRQVTQILRVLNFSTKRKINSPHNYIQLSATSSELVPNETRR